MAGETHRNETGSSPWPSRISAAFAGASSAFVLKAAVELDLFTKLDHTPKSANELAAEMGAAERGIRTLCDYLTIQGILEKADGRYRLTADSAAYLSRNSPKFVGSIGNFLTSDFLIERYRRAPQSILDGSSARGDDAFDPDHPMWVEFARSMAPLARLVSELAAEKLSDRPAAKILDVAASHGMFGLCVGERHPDSQVYALDWPNVLAYAQENAQTMGLGDRFHLLRGSAFEVDFGSGYDLVLVSNFLQQFDRATIVGFLQKLRPALAAGGRLALLEYVPDENRITPPAAAAHSMTMLLGTPAGDAYTVAEWRPILAEGGFAEFEATLLTPSPQTLLVAVV